MIKWFAYIVVLLIFTPYLSSAKLKNRHFNFIAGKPGTYPLVKEIINDTVTTKKSKKQEQEEKDKDKKTIKEVAKAKRQPKPEKVEPADNTAAKDKKKSNRQRRPEGLERPPEIPRRNGN